MNTPLRVLMVEDNDDDRLLLLRTLKQGGYEPISRCVQTATALSAALAEEPWDFVLSDYRLPQFNGMEALACVQKTGLDLPFIVVSGVIGEEQAVTIMKAGAHDYVLKDKLARLVPAITRELRDAEVRSQRRQAEAQLRASEAQFRLLFEANPNPMWVFDEETLQFLAVNDAALHHYGYTRDEFLALTVLDLRTPEDRPQVSKLFASQKGAKDASVGSFRHVKKDKTLIDVEITVSSIPFNGRPGRLVLSNDITEKKLKILRHGLMLDGRQLKPAYVSRMESFRLKFILREGRNRQIRRMCEMVDLEVVDLIRVRIGPLKLDNLPEGKWRMLTPDERAALVG